MTVAALLRDTTDRLTSAGIPQADALVEARILVLFALRLTPEGLRMYPQRHVAEADISLLEPLTVRRMSREPLAYIVGFREFYGLRFRVTPAVLIPRPETEFLVEAVLRFLGERPTGRVVDVGTGSGCIAIAIASHAPEAAVFATDISADALTIARENADVNGVSNSVHFTIGDLLTPVADIGLFDVVVSNPPYIAADEIERLEPEVKDWEPRIALGINVDALYFYKYLAGEALSKLTAGGLLAVEIGLGQADAVQALWNAAGLTDIHVEPDYAGIARVVIGRKPSS